MEASTLPGATPPKTDFWGYFVRQKVEAKTLPAAGSSESRFQSTPCSNGVFNKGVGARLEHWPLPATRSFEEAIYNNYS